MSTDHFHIAPLDAGSIERLRGLEDRLGKSVVALQPDTAVAELSTGELADLQQAERELGVVLVAFEPEA